MRNTTANIYDGVEIKLNGQSMYDLFDIVESITIRINWHVVFSISNLELRILYKKLKLWEHCSDGGIYIPFSTTYSINCMVDTEIKFYDKKFDLDLEIMKSRLGRHLHPNLRTM